MDNIYNRNKDIGEAIRVGERTLVSLNNARSYLDSAKRWSWVDLFGGGALTSFIKHSKLNSAEALMEDAKRDLSLFKKELLDINNTYLTLDIGSFTLAVDIFLDNAVFDYVVQRKINNAKDQVDDAIYQTENILARLKSIN